MPKLARACAVVVAVATSLAGGIAAAQIQSGNARKTAAPSIALGVPAAAANANSNATTKTHLSQRSSSSTATRSGNLTGCSAHLANFSSYLASGLRLILPARCDIAENSWSGAGYFTVGSGLYLGAVISDGLSGGLATQLQASVFTNTSVGAAMPARPTIENYSGSAYGDPIDMVQGHFLYDHEDINVGVGSFPQSLAFKRLYSSGMRNQNGPLGKGWTHNFNAGVALNSDGFQAMGEDSALDAVGTIVEHKASFDLLMDPTRPLAKLVTATLGQRWFGDQLIDNTVIVTQGLNGEVFVKLPDGSYNPPPGKSAKLTKNTDGTYAYELLNRAVLKFNTAGKPETYTEPSGVQAKFTYTGNDLTQVQNSLGRSLSFTNSGGRIIQVSDGTRSVSFGYDSSANLTSFTNAAYSKTTYAYGLTGQMVSLYYPSFPTTAAATNVYDSLGRVKTQSNARGKTYEYYFAGFRTEEIGPGGTARTNYLDALGNTVQSSTPAGNWTVSSYDGQSRLVRRQLPEGNATEYTYDDASCASTDKRCTHNVKTVTSIAKSGSGLANRVQSFTYESAFNKVASATDARGNTTSYAYTAQGLPQSVTAPTDPSSESFQVAGAGNMIGRRPLDNQLFEGGGGAGYAGGSWYGGSGLGARGAEAGALTSRAARREAMRDAGIPTSQQPVSQSRNLSGREYSYDVPAPGGGNLRMSVQQQTMDRSHAGQPHWEAGRVKTDPESGATRQNNYGRPALANDKSKVDYQ